MPDGSSRLQPFGTTRSETLGGQAFLHALVASLSPLPDVNGVPAHAALVACAAAAWLRRPGPRRGKRTE